MSGGPVRTADVVTATVALAGAAAVALPSYVVGIVQVALVGTAVAVAVRALSIHVPETGWLSPFKWMSPLERVARARRKADGGSAEPMRTKLSGTRRRIPGGPAMPAEAVRSLQTLIARTLDLDVGVAEPAELAAARERLSDATWAILVGDPSAGGWRRAAPPNRAEVARAVHETLDELDALRTAVEDQTPSPILPPSPPSVT